MACRLKWMKAKLREVIQGGRRFSMSSDIGGPKDSSQFSRLLKFKHGEDGARFQSSREQRSRAVQVISAHKDVQSEHSLKEAVASLVDRLCQGIAINSYSYVDVLQGCFKLKDFESLKQVHDCIKKSGLEENSYVANNLLKCYVRCGRFQNAQELFNTLKNKDIVSWTIMIGGYAENNQAEDSIKLYKQLREDGGQPDAIIYLNVLKACAAPNALKWGKDIHGHILHDGFQVDLRVGNALVSMYAKCGSIEDARAVFERMEVRDVISWNAIIGGLAQHGYGHQAFSLFIQMQREGFSPNFITYLCILSARAKPEDLAWVKKVHSSAQNSGFAQLVCVNNALIFLYAKCGRIDSAKLVFDSMVNRTVISWNAMIGGLAQLGFGLEACSLFLQMVKEGFTPDLISYVSILNPCSSKGALAWVREVHAHATRAGLDLDVRVGTALVHMYAKIGCIVDARQVFNKMLDRDVISWTAMIGGLAQNGHGRVGLQLFEETKDNGVKLNGPLFVAVLSACSHAGLVDDGRFQFVSMTQDYNIDPALEHYNCLVDILGRAGHLEEANFFIHTMPIKPVLVSWLALLGACRIYRNSKLGELAAKECFKLDPMDPSAYVLLSNIYAATGNWEQVSFIRTMMRENGIRKDPGRSWIEVGNKVHHFVAGDTSHPEAREIHAMLNNLFQKLEGEGYTPDTRLVLRNLDGDDRESVLFSHSEKLAIAYGLMHVPTDQPIRIYKNLRICPDCHAVTKLISKITGREIVARDGNRFHHFKEGCCSCGDYW